VFLKWLTNVNGVFLLIQTVTYVKFLNKCVQYSYIKECICSVFIVVLNNE